MKNYYLILGINSTATGEEIKSAFRRRAKELHPDRSGMESEPFQELQEAYGILSDPESRRRYDQGTDVTVVRRAPQRPSAEPLVRRRRPEPFNPFSASGIEEHTETFRDVSLGESFELFHPSFDELLDWLWSDFEDIPTSKIQTPRKPDGREERAMTKSKASKQKILIVDDALVSTASCCWAWHGSFGGSRKTTASGGKCIGCHK